MYFYNFFYTEPNEGLAESVASARLHHQVFSFEIFPSDSFCSLLQEMFQNILISDFTAVLGNQKLSLTEIFQLSPMVVEHESSLSQEVKRLSQKQVGLDLVNPHATSFMAVGELG